MIRDVRFGLRMLFKQPGFTLTAVLTLALGIGANTAVFSVVNAVVLRPLPYRDAGRLVMIWGNFLKLGMERLGAKAAEYSEYSGQQQIFAETAAFVNASFNLTQDGQEPERIVGAAVTPGLFSMLGAQAATGRTFAGDENETGRDRVAVISHGLWRRRFGSDPTLLNERVTLDGQTYEVVGVMPAGFEFPHRSFPFAEPADLFVPLTFNVEQIALRQGRWEHNVMARLKPGVTVEQAGAEMAELANSFEQRYRGYRGPNGEDGGWRITVVPLQQEVTGGSRQALFTLLGIVGLVLLIACANVANLLLARAAERQKEIAVRMALGAGRWRIVRQLLAESVLLAGFGGALGLLLAYRGVALLIRLDPNSLPRVNEVSVDGLVLLFTSGLVLFTSLFFGLVPTFTASRPQLSQTLREVGAGAGSVGRRFHLRSLFVVGEIALALTVLISSGLMLTSFLRLTRASPGLNPERVLTAEITLPFLRYSEDAQAAAFYARLLDEIGTLPGAQSAGVGAIVPISGIATDDPFSIEGRPLDVNRLTVAGHQVVSPGFFRTLEIPLRRGRDFTAGDAGGAPDVAIINETMARAYWPGEDPLGRRIKLGAPRAPGNWATIIGVVGDIPHRGLDSQPSSDWYIPHAQAPRRTMTLFVRTEVDPTSISAALRRRVEAIDAAQPVSSVSTLTQVIDSSVAPHRFNVLLLGLFGALALVLAATGIYAVMAHTVGRRTREVGVRVALGARRRDVMRLILRQGLMLTLAGVALGVPGAVAATRVIRSLLFGVSATDPVVFAGVGLLLIGVALLACWLPARRAARIDPITALRHE